MELLISRLLSLGVITSSLVVIVGGALMIAAHGATPADFSTFHGQSTSLAGVPAIISAALAGTPRAIIQVGLLILVATPVMRVALSVVLFLKSKDYLYVGITLLVLVILAFAILDTH